MIRNYFKIAIRNILNNKLYSIINIGGLALGLAACILIVFYVSHENSYDEFHTDSDRIFSLRAATVFGSDTLNMMNFSAPTAGMISERSPDVESSLRSFSEYKDVIIKNPMNKDLVFSESGFQYFDKNLLDFFSFNLKSGDKKNALNEPFSLLISDEIAKKYFGDKNPIGKILEVKKDSIFQFKVTGVLESAPSNSTIETKFIASFASLEKMNPDPQLFRSQSVQGGAFRTLFKLKDPTKASNVAQTADVLSKEGFEEANDSYSLHPFTNTHLEENRDAGIDYLQVFPLIAGLILLLALINYVSLTTARATARSKEIGIRKVNGADRKSIATQFYLESTIYITISFVLAGLLSYLLENKFFDLLDIAIDGSFFFNKTFLTVLGLLFILSIVAAGLYPAIIMSAFKPVDNFKTQVKSDSGGNLVRKVCTTLQFTIAVVLIIGGLIIQQQMSYLRSIDTGLDRSEIIMVPISNTMSTKTNAFIKDIENIPGIEQTSLSSYPLYGGYDIYFASAENTEDLSLPFMQVDENFLNVLNVKWKIEPENFQQIIKDNTLVINQKTIQKFHLNSNPIGQSINLGNTSLEIVGVVEDFNYSSLSNPIDALGITISPKSAAANRYGTGCLYINYQASSNLPQILASIDKTYKTYDAETPFSYQFMDDAFNAMFKSEERLSKMFNLFILFTIIIAGVGLLGLAIYSAQKRVKEIGIRKVLGASVLQIASLLSLDFLKLIGLAIIIAVPIAWYFADSWLQNFAYKMNMQWWIFVLASAFTLLLALITVSFTAIKAAIANPADSLRTE